MGQAVLSREELGKELAELEKQLEACCTLCADSIQTVVSSACSLRVEGRGNNSLCIWGQCSRKE